MYIYILGQHLKRLIFLCWTNFLASWPRCEPGKKQFTDARFAMGFGSHQLIQQRVWWFWTFSTGTGGLEHDFIFPNTSSVVQPMGTKFSMWDMEPEDGAKLHLHRHEAVRNSQHIRCNIWVFECFFFHLTKWLIIWNIWSRVNFRMFLERMTMTHWLQRKRNQSIPAPGLDAALGFATGALNIFPICEPWCWNMHTNIYPNKITQFCR